MSTSTAGLRRRRTQPAKRSVGRPFRFSAAGSSDPDPGDTLRYRWHFDDGAKAKGITVEHAFSDPGRHRAGQGRRPDRAAIQCHGDCEGEGGLIV